MSPLKVWSEFFQLNDEHSEVNIVQLEDATFWFQFSHLAKLLGYANPTVAIQTHCDEYEVKKLDIGQHYPVNFVSESGFYSLVLGSQKPIAKKFKKWVCSEVLPKLRSEGGYIMPTASRDQIEALQIELTKAQDLILKSSQDCCRLQQDKSNLERELAEFPAKVEAKSKAIAVDRLADLDCGKDPVLFVENLRKRVAESEDRVAKAKLSQEKKLKYLARSLKSAPDSIAKRSALRFIASSTEA